MNKIKAIASHRFFVPAVFFFLVFLLIFFAGPYFSFAGYVPLDSFVSQLLLFLIVLGIYCLSLYIKHVKLQKNQDKMVAEIAADDGVNEAIDAESKALRNKFTLAFDTLKKTKGGPVSLTEIPWYMIIGSPGSGKTTLLSNSGLNFPLFKEFENKAVQGVGGTKNCDWWITQNAVLLDTAGRYSSQDSFQKVDASGWKNFLAMIKRYRKKPISGILLSFSMIDLMAMNEYELSQLVFQMKQRIAEVNDFFATKFPIYVIVTKSDIIAGFTQFYEPLSHKEREQALGITFDKHVSIDGSVVQNFHIAFDALLAAQSRRQWTRMSLERDASRKSLIYGFTDQFASLKPSLIAILEGLGRTDDDMSTGIIRGLYFTSAAQSGAPIDRMIAKVSRAFGLKNNAKVMWNNDERSFFIKDLLQHVVFKEADQFGTLSGYERKKHLVKLGLMTTAGVFTVAVCAGLFVSYSNNARYIVQSENAVKSWVEQYDDKKGNEEIRQYIPALNDFASDIQGLQDSAEQQFTGLGLHQADSLQSALNASYKRLLQTVLLPYVQKQVANNLRQASDINEQYQSLKTYLMMANIERRDIEYIKRYMSTDINKDQYFSEAEYNQVINHIENLVDNSMMFDAIDKDLVVNTRRILSSQPLGEIYYKQFKETFLSNTANYLSMAQLAGSGWRLILTTNANDVHTISRLYTPEVFKQILDKDIALYIEQLNTEAWILGPDNVINQTGLFEQIEKLYARDYVNAWQGLLNNVSIGTNTNIASLNASLQRLIEVDSPLFVLLGTAAQATQLVKPKQTLPSINLGNTANKALNVAKQAFDLDGPEYFITSRFSKLHELMVADKKLATEQRLSALLQEINIALSFQIQSTKSVLDPNIMNALQGYGYLQVDPLNRWIGQLASSIRGAQDNVQKEQISAIWEQQILPTCKEIVDFKYPFQPTASIDASLRDLNKLFAPQGMLFQFFNQNIAPLTNMQSSPWQFKDTISSNANFDSKMLIFFEQIHHIQSSLYAVDGSNPSLQLMLKPVYLDPRLARFRMQTYGQILNYQFGRPTASPVNWPPENAVSSTQLSYVRRDGSEILQSQEGMFALFKLVNSAQVKRIDQNKVNITFSKDSFSAVYELSAASPIDPLVFFNMANLSCINRL